MLIVVALILLILLAIFFLWPVLPINHWLWYYGHNPLNLLRWRPAWVDLETGIPFGFQIVDDTRMQVSVYQSRRGYVQGIVSCWAIYRLVDSSPTRRLEFDIYAPVGEPLSTLIYPIGQTWSLQPADLDGDYLRLDRPETKQAILGPFTG